jgi:chromosome segregation ATPase
VEELRAWQRNAAERIKAMERRRVQEKEDGLTLSLPDGFSGDQDLARAYQELRVQLTHLLDSLELKSRQLDESRAQMKELTFQLRKERQSAREQVDYVSQLHEDTLDQLNLLEQAHIHLTRSYRDLNDRTIRMRNEMKAEPSTSQPPSPEKTDKPSPPTPASDNDMGKGHDKGKGSVKLKMT